MANKDCPHGFQPYGRIYRTNSYPLASANTRIARGDILVMTVAGTVDIGGASATQIIGVAAEGRDANSGASTDARVNHILVYDDPNQLFEAQADSADISSVAAVFANFNITATASTTQPISQMEIDGDTGATTATLPLKVLKILPAIDNAYGANVRMICSINNHALKSVGVDGLTT